MSVIWDSTYKGRTVFFGSGYACATLLKPEILSIPLDPFSLGDNNVQEADGHTHLLNQIRDKVGKFTTFRESVLPSVQEVVTHFI